MYEFKEEYKTGIDFVDAEHQRLFEIAEDAYQLQQNEFIPDKYDNIIKILEELRDYTKSHFAHEESYMKEIGYKGMFTQKVQHDAFIAKLDEMDLQSLDEDSDEAINDILTFLTNWLVSHILNVDKLIGSGNPCGESCHAGFFLISAFHADPVKNPHNLLRIHLLLFGAGPVQYDRPLMQHYQSVSVFQCIAKIVRHHDGRHVLFPDDPVCQLHNDLRRPGIKGRRMLIEYQKINGCHR